MTTEQEVTDMIARQVIGLLDSTMANLQTARERIAGLGPVLAVHAPGGGPGRPCFCNTFVRPERQVTKLAGIVAANYARTAVPLEGTLESLHLQHPVYVREAIRKAFFDGVRAASDLSAARQKWPDDPRHGKGGYHDNRRK